MKIGTIIFAILLISSLSLVNCSKENPNDKGISQKTIIKKTISQPLIEKSIEQTSTIDEPLPVAEVKNSKEIEDPEKEGTFYLATGEESISNIAARKDVYGDPLKWILLYRYNREAFSNMEKDESFLNNYVPAGTRLKLAYETDIGKNLKMPDGNPWVVNVLSSTEDVDIVPTAVKLVDNGFSAYITEANVNGRDYKRLRIGFFEKRSEAEDEAKKITSLLNTSGLWTTKADEAEIKEFGGYK